MWHQAGLLPRATMSRNKVDSPRLGYLLALVEKHVVKGCPLYYRIHLRVALLLLSGLEPPLMVSVAPPV